jgi:hypothetical protein
MTGWREFGFVVAALVLAAVCLAPSGASAHAGHVHAAKAAAPAAIDVDHEARAVAAGGTVLTAAHDHGGTTAPSTPDCDCDGCCGMTATCCGVALAPNSAGLAGTSPRPPFLTRSMQTLYGLPPEALPKPPRSFA